LRYKSSAPERFEMPEIKITKRKEENKKIERIIEMLQPK
jgi:hypothetical protein